MQLAGFVEGVGVLGPGLPDWNTARPVLTGETPFAFAPSILPAPAALPPAERRRASRVVKAALTVADEAIRDAGVDAAGLTTVFSASGSDGHNCHALCEALAGADRQISPTRFHNSVHNAPAGYWSIAAGAHGPCQALCAYDASFSAGLLEALVQLGCGAERVLLVTYDIEYPSPINEARTIIDAAGIALVLTRAPGARALARIDAVLEAGSAEPLDDPDLERLRAGNPSLRGLPLLRALARRERQAVSLEYLAPLALLARVEPC